MNPSQSGTDHPPPSGQPTKNDPARLTRLMERERALRALLIGARDSLIRERLRRSTGRGPAASRRAVERSSYGALRRRVRTVLIEALPIGAMTLVVSRGDDQLLDLGAERRARHFPSDGAGGYAGHHPADAATAIAELESERSRGAQFLVFPATSAWWLDHYAELRAHLEKRYALVLADSETCVVYDLRAPSGRATTTDHRLRLADRPAGAASRATRRKPFCAATIISRNYLAQARVLARSFLQHEPESRFYLLAVDRLPEDEDPGAGVTVVDPRELAIPTFWEMCFKYGIVEFNTAVKPYFLSLLFERYGEDEVAYFDPDILVMRPLDELRAALDAGSIVLTPHITRPVPLDGKRPSEQDIMVSGAFNLGFLGLSRSTEAAEFLAWWRERLQDGCRIDVSQGLFTDQKWIDLVPGMFPSTILLRDTTYNVAFWNLHERTIERSGDEYLVNGRPAGFFHISGFDPHQPRKLSKHQTRTVVESGSPLADLLDHYSTLLQQHGHEQASGWEYGFERFANGLRVHPLLRRLYLNLSPEERSRFGDPFAADGPDSFLDWATRPTTEEGGLSRFLRTVYHARYDLPSVFPDVRGKDRAAFLKWARRWGCVEMKFAPELVRDPAEGSQPSGQMLAVTASGPAKAPALDAASAGGSGPSAKRRAERPAAPRRADPQLYDQMIRRVRSLVRASLPAGSRVLVVSRGDYRLLELGGCEGAHFPQAANGVYGGYHPSDSETAIAHLEALRRGGAQYLLIPQTALWWLEHYVGFRRHLEQRYQLVIQSPDACLVYSLRRAAERPAAATGDTTALVGATP